MWTLQRLPRCKYSLLAFTRGTSVSSCVRWLSSEMFLRRWLYTTSPCVFKMPWILKRFASCSDNGVVLRTQTEFSAEMFTVTATPLVNLSCALFSLEVSVPASSVWVYGACSTLMQRLGSMGDCPLADAPSGCLIVVITSEGNSAIPYELTVNSDHQI